MKVMVKVEIRRQTRRGLISALAFDAVSKRTIRSNHHKRMATSRKSKDAFEACANSSSSNIPMAGFPPTKRPRLPTNSAHTDDLPE